MVEPAIQKPGAFTEGVPFVVQFRVVDKVGTVVLGGSISATYLLNVYDVTTRGNPTLVHTETFGNLVKQNMAVTNGWDLDEDGWNAQVSIDPGAFSVTNAVGGKAYKFELTLTVATEAIAVDWRQVCLGRAGT